MVDKTARINTVVHGLAVKAVPTATGGALSPEVKTCADTRQAHEFEDVAADTIA